MTTTFVRISPIISQQFPSGTVGGDWAIWITRRNQPTVRIREYKGPSPSTSFEMEEGPYTAWGVRLDAQDNPIGNIVQSDFDVAPGEVDIDVAGGINVVLEP